MPIKILYLLISQIFEIPGIYSVFGFINKRVGFIDSVFLCYAGSPKYGKYYAFPGTEHIIKWRSSPIGIFKQGDKWGLALGALFTEKDFINPKNRDKINGAIDRVEQIASAIGAEKISLAGILPSYLEKQGRHLKGWSNAMPAKAVVASYRELCNENHQGNKVPIILLGGSGNLGIEIQKLLKKGFIDYDVVDIKSGKTNLPDQMRNKPCILIDVSKRNVLKAYIDQMWPDITLLNETFPEPSKALIKKLTDKNIHAYHIAGVAGKCYPTLPYGYKKSIPCCAMHNSDKDILPVVEKLNGKRVPTFQV